MRARAAVLGFLAAAFIAVPAFPAEARSYRYESIEIDVVVNRDGSMRIREERTISFDGTYRGLFRRFDSFGDPTTGFDRLTVFDVLDDGRRLEPDPSRSERPGTYVADEAAITWFASITDETKTFTLDYKIDGHVKRYPGVAELAWIFVEPDRGASVERTEVTIHLPVSDPKPAPGEAIPDDALFPKGPFPRAWGYGVDAGDVRVVDEGTIRLTTSFLRDGEFVEARVAFDPTLVPLASSRQDPDRLRELLDAEAERASAVNRALWIARIRNVLPGLGLVGLLVLFATSFFRHGREHRIDVGEYRRELPADVPPAVVGWAWRWQSASPTDMTATILDLARRGYLTISERSEEKGLVFKRDERIVEIGFTEAGRGVIAAAPVAPRDNLQSYERHVLELLRDVEQDEERVTAETLERWAKAKPARMQTRFQTFKSQVAAHGRKLALFEKRGGTIALVFAAALAVGLLSIWALSQSAGNPVRNSPVALVALPGAILCAVFSPVLRQRSRTGAKFHAEWAAFRRFLEDFSRMKEAPPLSLAIWEHYLVYAVPLGVADAVIEAMRVHLPADAVTTHRPFLGYHFTGGGVGGIDGVTSSLSSLTGSFTASASAAFSTAPASKSGGGGGFSGGGGGGGGGGGSSGAF